MQNKLMMTLATIFILTAMSPALRSEVVLDKKVCSFADAPTGYWRDVGIPAGWLPRAKDSEDVLQYHLYTTATKFIQIPDGVTVSYVTGKKVTKDTCYKIEADLGGRDKDSVYATLMATENSDGTGKAVELVRVTRTIEGGDTYILVATSANSEKVNDAVVGYYLHVVLGVTKGRVGYFKNISVVSDLAEAK